MERHNAFTARHGSDTTHRINSLFRRNPQRGVPDIEDAFNTACDEVGVTPASKVRKFWELAPDEGTRPVMSQVPEGNRLSIAKNRSRPTNRVESSIALADLVFGHSYTRLQIHDAVGGGDLQSYLPNKGGIILAGCFDPELNVRAPVEIELGAGSKIERAARLLVDQGAEIPVFLKHGSRDWVYQGRFRALRYGDDEKDLGGINGGERRPGTVAVLYLSEQSSTESTGMVEDPLISLSAAIEGGVRLKMHYIRERNRSLVKAKRREYRHLHGQLQCSCCDIRESDLPAELGEGCFEVHHLRPLSSRSSSEPTRFQDLAIVCSNCHRMIHRGSTVLSIRELRRRISGVANG